MTTTNNTTILSNIKYMLKSRGITSDIVRFNEKNDDELTFRTGAPSNIFIVIGT